MKRLPLHWKIIIGLLAGVLWAMISIQTGLNSFTLDWINPWGVIFINLLKLIAVPLVLFSVIKGMMELQDVRRLGKLGIRTLLAYLATTVFAVTIGLLVVNTMKPGESVALEQRETNRITYELWVQQTPGAQIIDERHFLADSSFASKIDIALAKLTELDQNTLVKTRESTVQDVRGSGPLQFVVDMVPDNIFLALNKTMMLQIIFFALFFGITLVLIPRAKAEPVAAFVDGTNEVFLKMVDLVMRAAPFFVFALMAGKLVEIAGDNLAALGQMMRGLGMYMVAVLLGLALMIFVVYPLLFVFWAERKSGRRAGASYRHFFRSIGPAQLLAFSTSSSAATLPVTMECVHDNLKVPKEVTNFVLPIGATVNMDGTSLYQAVAVVFLAQLHLVELDALEQATIVLTATLASIGSAAVPSAGLIMMMVVLESIGLPGAWIAIVFPVDRLLDMCRTVVNVTGDATVSSVIAGTLRAKEVVPTVS